MDREGGEPFFLIFSLMPSTVARRTHMKERRQRSELRKIVDIEENLKIWEANAMATKIPVICLEQHPMELHQIVKFIEKRLVKVKYWSRFLMVFLIH